MARRAWLFRLDDQRLGLGFRAHFPCEAAVLAAPEAELERLELVLDGDGELNGWLHLDIHRLAGDA
jgi:hypothetical protein